jgi:putative endonuclease
VTRSVGDHAEELARQYLEKQGLITREQNYRTKFGELDLIMQDGEVLVFVEVKYRSSDRFGNPLEAVDLRKQRRIKMLARHYMAKLRCEPLCRFDVVGILGNEIYWVKGAFT